MLDEYSYHYDKYDRVEEYDGKDGSQEGTKEHTSVANEAAGGYIEGELNDVAIAKIIFRPVFLQLYLLFSNIADLINEIWL